MRTAKPVFSPKDDFVAVRAFTLNGMQLHPGDHVERENVSEGLLRKMFDNRMIIPKPAGATGGPVAAPEGRANAPASTGPKEAGSGPLRAAHRGFGRYYLLDSAGNVVSGPFSKEEAERHAQNGA